jgi:hypothetical protein
MREANPKYQRGSRDKNAGSQTTAGAAGREIALKRVFDAPRELVFDAWTDPKQITQWWGPTGFTTTTAGSRSGCWTTWNNEAAN